MIVITDILNEPFDEGAKIATRNLSKYIKKMTGAHIFAINTISKAPLFDNYFELNKLLFDFTFYKVIKEHKTKILYIPEASITFFTFIRAKLLNFFTDSEIYVLSLQPRTYGLLEKYIIRAISPNCVITQSKKTAQYLSKLGINNRILPLGVDNKKYCQFSPARKRELRAKHEIDYGKTVLLHVGHIQKSRNLEWLINVKEATPTVEIIVVGSTFNQDDEELYKMLHEKEIRVIREYTPKMEEIYNLADYYIFPVLKNDGAIETPLSVLEAMACNLPVITSRFGSLPDVFKADNHFHYIQDGKEIVKIINKTKDGLCNNRAKVEPYTWKKIAQQLVLILE